jgi:hypothetical protein
VNSNAIHYIIPYIGCVVKRKKRRVEKKEVQGVKSEREAIHGPFRFSAATKSI